MRKGKRMEESKSLYLSIPKESDVRSNTASEMIDSTKVRTVKDGGESIPLSIATIEPNRTEESKSLCRSVVRKKNQTIGRSIHIHEHTASIKSTKVLFPAFQTRQRKEKKRTFYSRRK